MPCHVQIRVSFPNGPSAVAAASICTTQFPTGHGALAGLITHSLPTVHFADNFYGIDRGIGLIYHRILVFKLSLPLAGDRRSSQAHTNSLLQSHPFLVLKGQTIFSTDSKAFTQQVLGTSLSTFLGVVSPMIVPERKRRDHETHPVSQVLSWSIDRTRAQTPRSNVHDYTS